MAPFDICQYLSDDIFELRVEGSNDVYKIHKGLFEAKIGFNTTRFKEGQEKKYVFQGTGPLTVLKFVEWAYTSDYSPITVNNNGNNDTNGEEGTDIPCHAHVYVFADTYNVAILKDLAFSKLTASIKKHCIAVEGDKETPVVKLDPKFMDLLMRLFKFCYVERLPDGDQLLEWLGKFAAWRLKDLQECAKFESVMSLMYPYVLKHLQTPGISPWKLKDESKPKMAGGLFNNATTGWPAGTGSGLFGETNSSLTPSFGGHFYSKGSPLFGNAPGHPSSINPDTQPMTLPGYPKPYRGSLFG